VVVVEKRGALVATEGDEVVAALGLVALQVAGHEGIVTPGTLYPTHPQRTRMNGAPKMGLWVGHLPYFTVTLFISAGIGEHTPGAKARVVVGLDVWAEAQTYLEATATAKEAMATTDADSLRE